MRRIAAIDVGSNSVLLQIVECSGKRIVRTVSSHESAPRISEGLKETGCIGGKQVRRLTEVLANYALICRDSDVDAISCYGTSAMRKALNGRDVVASVKKATGLRIVLISGRKEAALTYIGASSGMRNLKARRIVIDSGGGSTEVVVAERKQILSARSFGIGAVEFTEKYKSHRKLSRGQFSAMIDEVRSDVAKRIRNLGDGDCSLIVSGGTPTALMAYELGMKTYVPDRLHGRKILLGRYRELIEELALMSHSERRNALSFEPSRAYVIAAGGLLSLAFAEHVGVRSVRVSERGLRWGQLYELLGERFEFA